MRIEFEFHTTLRDAVGEKTVRREFDSGTTVSEAVRSIAAEYDGLGPLVFRSDGALRSHLTVAVDGDPLSEADRDGRALEGEETIVLAPGVAGGTTEPVSA